MIGIGEKMPEFNLVSVKPGFNEPEESGESAFESFSDSSFDGKWKVIYFIQRILLLFAQLKLSNLHQSMKS